MGLFTRLKAKMRKGELVIESTFEPEADPFEADSVSENDSVHVKTLFTLEGFWHDNAESLRRHVSAAPTDKDILEVEGELGYKLPESYIALMRTHNGGLVNRCRYKVPFPEEGSPDTIYITEILGIGREKPYSLCGRYGSSFLIETRRHNPEIGIALCNTTLPGRALVFLDYRSCGRTGEPSMTWADAQTGAEITLAGSFKEFILGLEENRVETGE
ncbi:MAG: SMI1/KNR4 family protein [Clostridiales bacterium]|nr:SMI1/KNR4 family protein [Clostridiales bacterium]